MNAVGSVVVDRGPWFWAAPFEQNSEFGGRGFPATFPPSALTPLTKGTTDESTTLVVVATDAKLDKAQAKRLAIMAQSGLSRAIYPVHTPSTATWSLRPQPAGGRFPTPMWAWRGSGTLAANVVARAVARGVFEATTLGQPGAMPSWKDQFGR